MDADLTGGVGKADPTTRRAGAVANAEIRKHSTPRLFDDHPRRVQLDVVPAVPPGGVDPHVDRGRDGTALFDTFTAG